MRPRLVILLFVAVSSGVVAGFVGQATAGKPRAAVVRVAKFVYGPCPIPAEFRPAFERASRKARLPLALLAAVANVESEFRPDAHSPAGAHGLLQVLPSTAKELKLDTSTPENNVLAGARYLRILLDRFKATDLALAAYNAGPTAVEKAGRAERRLGRYIKEVTRLLEVPERLPVAVVVLAAGAATVGAKQQLMLAEVLDRVRSSAEAARGRGRGRRLRAEDDARVVRCAGWQRGHGVSLRCGLDALGPDAGAAVVLLADGPDVSPAAIDRVVAAWRAGAGAVVAASYGGVRGHPVVLDRSVWASVPTRARARSNPCSSRATTSARRATSTGPRTCPSGCARGLEG